jgi:uncharacterized protein DUF7019
VRTGDKGRLVRYYLYISDSKVDMLLPQVPGALTHKVAAEFGFDIGLFAGKLSTERQTLENRVARLQAVERYLIRDGNVGTLAAPQAWFQDTALASMFSIPSALNLVFFLIQSSSYVAALGGSAHHVIGNVARAGMESSSFVPTLVDGLESLMEDCFDDPDDGLWRLTGTGVSRGGRSWTETIEQISSFESGPKQRVSFLARRLVAEDYGGRTMTLATPLFVALADEAT